VSQTKFDAASTKEIDGFAVGSVDPKLLDILVRARLTSVHEVPFAFGQRFRGASKANLKVAVDYGKLLARLYSWRFGSRRPVPVSSLNR